MHKTNILYLQLPLLDNDTGPERENFLFAAAYLDHALQQSNEAEFHESIFAPAMWDELDTHHLAEEIIKTGADVLVCTLYLWNIERTLRLAALLKQGKPQLKIAAGGPETAKEHPLLFSRPNQIDAVVVGEGEAAFPALLKHWRTGSEIDFYNTAIQVNTVWAWGDKPAPSVNLLKAQPSEEMIMQCVQHRPVVYLETVRGCPLTCSYCRYYQLHAGLRKLNTQQVTNRIRRFRELGAKEIRFVDPTFNARPGFTEFLQEIAAVNRDQHLSFFAEIRSDTLTDEQAGLMKQANFTEVEVGVQSIDPSVLKNVMRPVSLNKTGRGIQALCDAGVRVVLDIMYGLPEQDLGDVRKSLEWGLSFGESVQVQCMQTLLLPGTVLRQEAPQWGFDYEPEPPYAIRKTSHLSPEDIQEIELFLDDHPTLPADPITPRFCSQRLSGLFKEQIRISTEDLLTVKERRERKTCSGGKLSRSLRSFAVKQKKSGKSNRRALLICGPDLFSKRAGIAGLIDRAITSEPDLLWQFVLIPEQEEPLDLLEMLAETIRNHEPHMLDRFASAAAFEVTVSRRLFVRTNKQISNDWKNAAEELLRSYFG